MTRSPAPRSVWVGARVLATLASALLPACLGISDIANPRRDAGAGDASTDAADADAADADAGDADAAEAEAGKDTVGCSDGTREAFTDPTYTDVAACAGGWSVPGVLAPASMAPACNRVSGNSSANPSGAGCSVADLCAVGWHVCASSAEFIVKSPGGCAPTQSNELFVTRQSENNGLCSPPPAANNLVGCGAGLGQVASTTCAPLNRELHAPQCVGGVWVCGGVNNEALEVVKTAATEGGVICCSD